ncbi:NUDIX hydrolase [Burkholderia sp. TSV86]|uniref:NUDIX hydrolase n=1 Tax=Burkholderia sp. TSV86 TaxID=1385594 RepID=UPI0018D27258|nr:NUDIX hydrolase [Burkholderia sp. TSV86]
MIHEYTGITDLPEPSRWTVHGRRRIYDNRWVSLDLIDVEPIGGNRYEHHVVTIPYEAVCVVVHHPDRGVLLLYRHRFITDTAGFELPAGGIGQGESSVDAAAREVLEETGWAISTPKVFMRANASDGVSTQRFHFVYARAEKEMGQPEDSYESQRLYWVPKEELPTLIKGGYVPGCPAMFGLLYALNFGYLDTVANCQSETPRNA